MEIATAARSQPASWILWLLGACAATLAAALLGLRLQSAGIAILWPAAGVIVGLMAVTRAGDRAAAAAGALVALAIGNLSEDRSLPASMVFMAGNLGQGWIAAVVLARTLDSPVALDRPAAVGAFLAIALAVPAVVALPAAAGLIATGHIGLPFPDVWWLWLSSHGIGIVTAAPIVIGLGTGRPRRFEGAIEDGAMAVAVATAAFVVIGGVAPATIPALALGAVLLGPLIWWVWRRATPTRAAVALLAMSAVTIWQTTGNSGVFGGATGAAQAFLLGCGAGLLLLGARQRSPEPASAPGALVTEHQALIALAPLMVFAALAWWTWSATPNTALGFWLRETAPLAFLALAASAILFWLTRRLQLETAERVVLQAKSRARRMQIYLLRLNEALRDLHDPAAVMQAASARLGQFVGAGQVAYGEIDAAREYATIERDWNDGSIPSNAARHRLNDFGAPLIAALERGETIVIDDVASDPRTADPQALATFRRVSISAFINVPLIKSGGLVAVLAIHSRLPRPWSEDDVAAARETAERTWAALERARAERALTLSQTLLHRASDVAGFGFYEFDVLSRTAVWSPSLHRISGTSWRESVPFDDALNTFHPDDRPRTLGLMNAALRQPGPYEIESRIVRPDGSVRWILDRGEAVNPVDDHGHATRAIGIVIDITERKQAELEVARISERFRGIAEASPSILWAAMPDGTITYANDQWFRYCGVRPEENAVRWPELVLHPDDRERCISAWQHAVATGDDYEIEVRNRRHDGVYRWFLTRAQARRDSDGAIVSWYGATTDIHDRKQIEQALRAAHDTFRLLVERSPFGIYVVDADFRLVQVSTGAQQVFANVRPLIGRDFAEVLRIIWPEPFASQTIEQFRSTLSTGRPYHAPSTVERRRDTSIMEAYDWKLERITLPDGRYGVVCHFYDLSERQQYEEQIRTLLREVNHRSKNMLALVQAIARQTAASAPGDFIARFEERIHAVAANQELLVRGDWNSVALEDLIRTQLSPFKDLVGQRISLTGPQARVKPGASQTLAMILHELATNAGKYGALSDGSGTVAIAWSIAETNTGQVFQLSWQESGGPPVIPPARRGFGSTVVGALAKSNFAAEVELDHAPQGLRWQLTCPADQILDSTSRREDVAPADATPPPAAPAQRLAVLVVEDEALLGLEIASALQDAGLEVAGPVGTVKQALALLSATGCGAAVLDVNLGQETSEPIARRLRELGIPFMIMSGYSRNQLPAVFRDVPLMSKPVQSQIMIGELKRILAARAEI